MINNGHTGKEQVAGRCPLTLSPSSRCQMPEQPEGDAECRLGAAGHRRVVAPTPSFARGGGGVWCSVFGLNSWLDPSFRGLTSPPAHSNPASGKCSPRSLCR